MTFSSITWHVHPDPSASKRLSVYDHRLGRVGSYAGPKHAVTQHYTIPPVRYVV